MNFLHKYIRSGNFLLKWLIHLSVTFSVLLVIDGGNSFSQPINIGLLIQDSSYTAAVRGAQLAVRIANEKGGLNGRPFRLAVRSMEGVWGTGSKQTVDLIFNEKVLALMGSHDGRNAHLVEQAATKSIVVFVSTWSGDPTLTQAFVPWFFNCMPNYDQQASALAEDIYEKRKLNSLAIVYDNEYDSKLSLTAFLRENGKRGEDDPAQFLYGNFNNDPDNLLRQIESKNIGGIILFCNPKNSHNIFMRIKEKKMDQYIYGSLYILNEDQLTINELMDFDNSILVPSPRWHESLTFDFISEYQKNFKTLPGIVAAYSYDGMNILLNAVRQAGVPDREKIQDALLKIEYRGVTGIIRFDEKGNRAGQVVLTKPERGIPSSYIR